MAVITLAVVFKLKGDNDGKVSRTELEILEDFPDALIARWDEADRGSLERKLGPPTHSAEAETEEYRDVGIWNIQACLETDTATAMILAVIYELDGDNDGDVAATELEILEDFPDALITREDKINRGLLWRKLGQPFHSENAETEKRRDVNVWKIRALSDAAQCLATSAN